MSNKPPPLCEAACQRFDEVHGLLHEISKQQREYQLRVDMLNKALMRLIELMNKDAESKDL